MSEWKDLPNEVIDLDAGDEVTGVLPAANGGTGSTKGATMPVWTKYTVGYAALAAASTTNNIELLSLPAKTLITRVIIKHTTAFSGGSLSSYTVSVGITGTLAKHCAAFDVFQAVADGTFGASTTAQTLENFGAATSIKIAATGSHNLNTATAGSVDVYVQTALLP